MKLYDISGNPIEMGTKDYTLLEEKPKINGVELSGDKSTSDLKIDSPTDEQVDVSVRSWLDEHPEATTTVQDKSIDYSKLTMLALKPDVVDYELTRYKSVRMIYTYYGSSKDAIDETKVITFKGGNYLGYYLDCRNISQLKCRAFKEDGAGYTGINIFAFNSFAESTYTSNPTEAPNKSYLLRRINLSELVLNDTEYNFEIEIDMEYPYIVVSFDNVVTKPSDSAFSTKTDKWYGTGKLHCRFYVEEGDEVVFNDKTLPLAIGKVARTYHNTEETDIYIAAKDSTDGDKSRATFICSGANDELIIQKAIDLLSQTSGTITLFNGNYYFDSFTEIENVGKFCICVKPNNFQRHITITGTNSPIRKYGEKIAVGSAIINITSAALNMINGTETQACVFGLASTTQRHDYPSYSFDMNKIGFNFADNQHKVICINGEMFSAMKASDLQFTIDVGGDTDDTSGYEFPTEGFIALRGLVTGNYGSGYLLSNMFAFGFDCAYDLGGEHLIATQLGCRFCNYSYRFNYYGASGLHPITLINCCDEGCVHAPYFSSNGGEKKTQSISLYDYNEEVHTTGLFAQQTKAYMESGQKFNGIVTYSLTSAATWGKINESFFEDGHGAYYKTINMPYIGTS